MLGVTAKSLFTSGDVSLSYLLLHDEVVVVDFWPLLNGAVDVMLNDCWFTLFGRVAFEFALLKLYLRRANGLLLLLVYCDYCTRLFLPDDINWSRLLLFFTLWGITVVALFTIKRSRAAYELSVGTGELLSSLRVATADDDDVFVADGVFNVLTCCPPRFVKPYLVITLLLLLMLGLDVLLCLLAGETLPILFRLVKVWRVG